MISYEENCTTPAEIGRLTCYASSNLPGIAYRLQALLGRRMRYEVRCGEPKLSMSEPAEREAAGKTRAVRKESSRGSR